ncbi:MAG TPA: glycosyltransferase family 39 protein, partial [bacterium]
MVFHKASKSQTHSGRKSDKKKFLFCFFSFALLFCVQTIPRLFNDAPTNDEGGNLTNGYYYWKGDVLSLINKLHPPFTESLQALPLQFMPLSSKIASKVSTPEQRAQSFFYGLNREYFPVMTVMGRSVSLLLGLFLGALLAWSCRESLVRCSITLALWAFEPNLLAFSPQIREDIPLTFWYFASVFVFQEVLKKPDWKRSLSAGWLTAAAVTTKFSAFILFPVFVYLEWLNRRGVKPGPREAISGVAARWGLGLMVLGFWEFLVYLPGTLKLPDHHLPFFYFWQAITSVVSFFSSSKHPVFFKGVLSLESHWDYYPTAFLLKSTLPFLILLLLAVVLAFRKKILVPAWQWAPPLFFFLFALPIHQIGLRQVLPIYPFLILIAASAGEWLWKTILPGQPHLARVGLIGLLSFHALTTANHYPAHISYFNELVPPERRIYWLGDSNLDIGQDVKRLADTAKTRGCKNVKLAFFGPTDPALYGMAWDYWRESDLAGPQPGWVYVVNDAFFQLGPAFLRNAGLISK